MGREWLYKASRGRDDGAGGKSSSSASTATAKRANGKRRTEKEKNNSSSCSSGCMSAIFNLFDIQHHHQFRFNHPAFISESTIVNHQQSSFTLQGVEAPRNSLEESPESDMSVLGTSKVKQQTNLNIPMGGIQIKTQRSRFSEDVSSECSSSPGTKTPNLVARLMGLDLLPEYSSPRASSSSTPATSHPRSRSLPTTPRVSRASTRSTENKDYHHRFSLQIDKENCNSCGGYEDKSLRMKMARRRSEFLVNRRDDGGGSQYGKEIVNQGREEISRRLGTDITNTMSSTDRNKEQRRDSNLVLLKPKQITTSSLAPIQTHTHVSVDAPMSSTKRKQDDSTHLVPSSQKLRLLDIKSNLNKPTSNSKSTKSKLVKDEKIKRITSERYDLRLKKSTSMPNLGEKKVKNTTKFLSFKKEMTSPSSTTRLPQKQVSLVKLPSSLNSPYKASDILVSTTYTVANGGSFSDNDHFVYISRILNQCGIHSTTPISFGQWYSPNHPIHPDIFSQLEKPHHSPATASRRMVFELVNEFLVEIVKPYMNRELWVCTRPYNKLENVIPPDAFTLRGSELIEKLCKKITNFPTANCEALEDIDRLIEADMSGSTLWSTTAFATEEIVMGIENEIVEMLVCEMATTFTDTVRSHVVFT